MTKPKPQIKFKLDPSWLTIKHITKQLHDFIREIERFANNDLVPSSVSGEVIIYWEPSEYPKSQQKQFLPEYRRRCAEAERIRKESRPLPDPELSLIENIAKIREKK